MSSDTMSCNLVDGDLLSHACDVIVQQCNCITLKSLGLSKSIAQKLGVDPYALRRRDSTIKTVADVESSAEPGTVSIHAGTTAYVACLYAQYAPGTCRKRYQSYERIMALRNISESAEIREQWFRQALDALAHQLNQHNLKHVAFPYGIGCGLAGGEWSRYVAMIEQWSAMHPDLSVDIVRKSP